VLAQACDAILNGHGIGIRANYKSGVSPSPYSSEFYGKLFAHPLLARSLSLWSNNFTYVMRFPAASFEKAAHEASGLLIFTK